MTKLIKKNVYLKKLQSGGYIPKFDKGGKYGHGKFLTADLQLNFSGDMYLQLYRAYSKLGVRSDVCARLARFGVTNMAYESGYGGSNLANLNHNYGGFTNGETFSGIEDFADKYASLMLNYYPGVVDAQNMQLYVHALYNGKPYDDGRPRRYNVHDDESVYLDALEGTLSRSLYGIDLWLHNNSKTPNPNFKKNSKWH